MGSKIIYTVDVEPDLHSGKFLSITEGLGRFEKICDENKIKPVLFVVGEVLEKNPKVFKYYHKKGWEISCHGYSHKRFDEMAAKEKEKEIMQCLKVWENVLKDKPKGFRAPQHSIDDKTLDLLQKYGFEYDSSYTPLNLIQLFFFPRKFGLWARSFFSPIQPYKIRENLLEIPTSALIFPFVSLTARILPKKLFNLFSKLICALYKKPIFYAHSWDFIALKDSLIDRRFSHKQLLEKLMLLMKK